MKSLKRLLPLVLALALVLPAVSPVFAETTYVVQPGDTLYLISVKFSVSMQALMTANGLANPNLIYVGQRLIIPGASAPSAPVTGGTTTYIVQAGDTLFKISLRFGVSQAALMAANGLTNPNLVYVGQSLSIPASGATAVAPTAVTPNVTPAATAIPVTGGTAYIVQAGDTLFKISLRFGVSQAALMAANGLTNANWIYVGQRLVIPGQGATPVVTATPVATTATLVATIVPPSSTQPPASGGTYVVRSGDTLWAISLKFNVSVAALKAANGLTSDYIYAGQQLVIPGTGSVTPAPTPAPGATPTPAVVPPPATGGGFELGGQVVDLSGAAEKMKYAGMFWVKVQDKWSPGAVASAARIDEAHSKGFKILISVVGKNPADIAGGANFDAFAAYVGELARLGADAIEVWNEMNIDREWPAGQINPATYTDLLRRAYTQIKAKNPNTLVISGAPAPTGAEGAFGLDHVWNDSRYLSGLAAAGAVNYMDCIGVHYNEGIISPTKASGDPRDAYFTRYYSGMVSTYYNAFGGARKLCFTELGYLTSEGYGPLPSAFGWAGSTTVAQQSQWLGEAASLSKSGGQVRLLIVFNVDFKVYTDDPQAGYAIIRPGGGCPACDSLRAVVGGR